ncbi:tyrosine-protein phosphatase [Salinimicrobium soli]|uniref:tyrosine-protein phosphatase n=1 Tax=Salinimicrobium soli TaxID=1254399 RepID=UPI003AAD6A04
MFSIFKKKSFLKDELEGFLDIHNHILPGIDDGAATLEDSLNLLNKYEELGVTEFIATPHIMNDYYPNNPQTIGEALKKVRTALDESNKPYIKIKAAAEYMMDQFFLELMEKEKLLCLHENYVLVEMSYFQAPINLNEILFKLQTQQYRPILAHPERYVYMHRKTTQKYEELKERGCYFQLNLLSILGHYGKNIQQAAFHLLDNELIDFIGSDTHQLRHLEKLELSKVSHKRIDQIKPLLKRNKEVLKPFS